ncbi:5921_t:CDS:2, partial [Gigaspora margarita]
RGGYMAESDNQTHMINQFLMFFEKSIDGLRYDCLAVTRIEMDIECSKDAETNRKIGAITSGSFANKTSVFTGVTTWNWNKRSKGTVSNSSFYPDTKN